MAETIRSFAILSGLVFTVGCCTAAFTFAVVVVCRWMKWAPINIIVNVNNYGEERQDSWTDRPASESNTP